MSEKMYKGISISAIIPTYNRERTIGRAIDSVLEQEYTLAEIIVIDDGSIDNTRKIVEGYGQRVRYIYQKNAGVSAARNRGVSEARYEWIAFLDSDDYWVPHYLSRMANAIEATRGEAELYFSDTQRPFKEGGNRHWVLCGIKINGDIEFKRNADEWAFLRTQPMMLQSSVIRRSTYLKIGELPASFLTREDTLLFFKLALQYPACAVRGCGAIMTSDDSVRLTELYDERSLTYCHATIQLYRELLASINCLGRKRRQLLNDKMSASYLAIGRVFFHRRQFLSTIRNLYTSFYISPAAFGKETLGFLSRRVLKTK